MIRSSKVECLGIIYISLIMVSNLWGNDSSFLTPEAIHDGWMKSYGPTGMAGGGWVHRGEPGG